jgi:hypothetical protein
VREVDLLVAAGALLGALAALATLRRLLPGGRAAESALALPRALGDAVLVLDRGGRIVSANDAAGRLAGVGAAALEGEPIAALGDDLRILARGIARGPASGAVTVAFRQGSAVRARAALARISSRPARDLVVLRPEPLPVRPPPLPAMRPAPPEPALPAPDEARAGLGAAAAAVRDPLARAVRAVSLLRLTSPRLEARPASALRAVEEALEEAERRVSALAAAGQPGVRRPLDLSALVADLVQAAAPPRGVRVRGDVAPARTLGDERPLRAALREVVRSAVSAISTGEVVVTVRGDAPAPTVIVAAPGQSAAPHMPLARALLAPHGVRVDELPGRDGAWRLRLVLPRAPADALASA